LLTFPNARAYISDHIPTTGDQKWALDNIDVSYDATTWTRVMGWKAINRHFEIQLHHLKRLVFDFNIPFEKAISLSKDGGKTLVERCEKAQEEQVRREILTH
jgi:hypothetical protein